MKPAFQKATAPRNGRALRPLGCALLALALARGGACAPEPVEPPAPAPAAQARNVDPVDRNHHLGPGDLVEITVTGFKEFSQTVRLFADGSFDYPILGNVQAAGLTVKELTERVTEGMKKELRRPNVNVALKEIYVPPPPPKMEVKLPTIMVLGAVAKKGEISLPTPRPLRAILAEISPTEKADLSRIRVRYPDGSARNADFSKFGQSGQSADDVLVKGGEEIIVLERPVEPPKETNYVRIVGQVANPTQYELKPQMTLEDLILAAGKLTPLADVKHVQLHRKGEPVQIINLVDQVRLGVKGLIRLQAGDEVAIPEQRNTVFLLGAVANPGPQALEPGQTVRDFFLSSGSASAAALNPTSVDLRKVELIRQGQPTRNLDLRAILKDPRNKENLALESGDVVFLPPKAQSRPGGVLNFLQQLGPLGFLFGMF